jgi:Tol biopolymer transport system component/predicted Ser/Thr protein kinase
MPLSVGDRLGPYEILAPIGVGGMGEVWKARDTRLDRIVAIKTSKAQFSERFAREARAIAALNHPHICQLYDVGPDYLVMEYVEGSPLTGPLPLEKATEYASQILSALDAAHRKTITHRDLKPGNILVSKRGVKLLDFGLARIAQGPTDSTLTQRGEIVGTPAYMSPEQWNGKPTDTRTDIYAFGCVLYEMLTGKRAAADMAGISEVRPPALASIVRDCMKSDPEERWQSVEDIRKALTLPSPPVTRSSSRWTWIAATAAVIFAILAIFAWMNRPAAAPPQSFRFSILPPEGTNFDFAAGSGPAALSPDGRTLAFVAETNGVTHVWLRPLDATASRKIDGTDEAYGVSWSPDGRFLAFPIPGRLRRIELATGTIRDLCAAIDVRGIAWNDRGDMVYAGTNGGLLRVSANGGEPAPVTTLDVSKAEDNHYWPQFLPDGHHLIYAARTPRPQFMGAYAVSLDAKAEPAKFLLPTKRNVKYVAASTGRRGFMLFAGEKELLAQRFDPDQLQTEGEPVTIADNIGGVVNRMFSAFSATPDVLAYWTVEANLRQLTLVTREGSVRRVLAEPATDISMSVSHDGKQAAIARFANSPTSDVWLLDLDRGVSTRFTSDPSLDLGPVWSPDDKEIAFTSSRRGPFTMYRRKVDGGPEEAVHPSGGSQLSSAWDAHANLLVYSTSATTNGDIMAIPPGGGDPIPIAVSQFDEKLPSVSPSGKWLAYISNDTGAYELYVQSFPKAGARKRISTGGAFGPQWRGDGKELYYSTPDNVLMAVDVRDDGGEFSAGTPKKLFALGATPVVSIWPFWQPMPDGKHFLVLRPAESSAGKPITIITNWQAGMK